MKETFLEGHCPSAQFQASPANDRLTSTTWRALHPAPIGCQASANGGLCGAGEGHQQAGSEDGCERAGSILACLGFATGRRFRIMQDGEGGG